MPDQLRKRMDLTGDAEATIVLTRARGHGIALLVAAVLSAPTGAADPAR